MQQLLAAPRLASLWLPCVRSGKTPRFNVTRIVNCVRSKRLLSASTASREKSGWELENFNLRCGSSGSITVDLYNSSALNNPSNTLIIYFPPTGTHLKHTHPSIPSNLITPKTALASINYRWNIPSTSSQTPSSPKELYSSPSYAHHAFPTPLHDVLAGYSFLLSHLTRYPPSETPPSSHAPPTSTKSRNSIYAKSPTASSPLPIQRPILLYGAFLGGTLATSLSLTESISSRSKPTKMIGLISKNGVYDWTDIASSAPSLSSSLSLTVQSGQVSHHNSDLSDSWDMSRLHDMKQSLFSSPASAFDSFASPTLFFRTSGLAIPRSWPTDDESTGNKCQSTSSDRSPSEAEDIWPGEEDDLFHISTEELKPDVMSNLIPASSPPSASAASLPNASSITPPSTPEFENATAKDSLARRMSQMFISPPSRPSHLRYPPANSNLKIPFSLFLYAPSPASSASSLLAKPPTKSKLKSTSSRSSPASSKEIEEAWQSQLETELPSTAATPETQAEYLASLLRRSVLYHESAERKMWDADLDAEGESERRAVVRCLGKEHDGREGGDEAEIVRRWMEETIL